MTLMWMPQPQLATQEPHWQTRTSRRMAFGKQQMQEQVLVQVLVLVLVHLPCASPRCLWGLYLPW